MNYFKEAERVLSHYNSLKKSLANIGRRKQRLLDSGAPQEISGLDFSKPYIDAAFVNDTYGQCLELLEVQREEQATGAKIAEIEDVVKQLRPENQKLIDLWYFQKKTKEEIAEIIDCYSKTTVYNYRNTAVGEFAVLYFGAGAIASV